MKEPITALCLREVDILFRPFLHRKINLSTRLVMNLIKQNDENAAAKISCYGTWAMHQIGLIITEPVAVNEASAALTPGSRSFVSGEMLRMWRRVCRVVHACGSRIGLQLCHAGMLRQNNDAMGPSGIDPSTLECRGQSMSREHIRQVVQAFGESAAVARRIGFDSVVIQGGDGYLIDQFMRQDTNRRDDEYGGDAIARVRFACEVLHAVRKAVGRRFSIVFRFTFNVKRQPLAASPAELACILQPLCEAGVDIFDCSGDDALKPAFAGSPLSVAGWTRVLTRRPVISEGCVETSGKVFPIAVRGLQREEFDLLAVGRAVQADAEWGSKVRRGEL